MYYLVVTMVSGVIISSASHVLFMLLLLFISPPLLVLQLINTPSLPSNGHYLARFKMNPEHDPGVPQRKAMQRGLELVCLPAQAETIAVWPSCSLLALIKV